MPPPGLNSARAAAACRSVRDAMLQASLRLQVCQGHCGFQQNHASKVPHRTQPPSPGSAAAHVSPIDRVRIVIHKMTRTPTCAVYPLLDFLSVFNTVFQSVCCLRSLPFFPPVRLLLMTPGSAARCVCDCFVRGRLSIAPSLMTVLRAAGGLRRRGLFKRKRSEG